MSRETGEILKKAIFILGLSVFLLTEAAPNLSLKSFNDGDINPIISLLCPTNEPCWNSLSDSSYIFEEEPEMQEPRIQTIRGANFAPNWQESLEKSGVSEKVPIPVSPFFNRISKKDVFMSRGWGAGGLPFSVLYMNAHNSRNNHGSTSSVVDSQKSGTQPRSPEMIPVPSKSIQQNYRVSTRNKATNQTRRQYSIIPQLFISYGWGPRGN